MEQIEDRLTPTLDMANDIASRIWLEFLALISLPQAIAISTTLLLAVVLHVQARRVIERVFSGFDSKASKRIRETISSITMPIVWVFGLWLAVSVFGSLGYKTSMIRLIASLINAWVVIRIASTLIPSSSWSRAFSCRFQGDIGSI